MTIDEPIQRPEPVELQSAAERECMIRELELFLTLRLAEPSTAWPKVAPATRSRGFAGVYCEPASEEQPC